MLAIDGTPQSRGRRLVYFGVAGKIEQVWLAAQNWRMMAILAIFRTQMGLNDEGRLSYCDGWVEKGLLAYPDANAPRYLYRLRSEISGQVPRLVGWALWDNDREGHYRLQIEPEAVSVNCEAVKRFGDHALNKILYQCHPGLWSYRAPVSTK